MSQGLPPQPALRCYLPLLGLQLGLLAAAGPAGAQLPPAPGPAGPAADTAAALHRLFAHQRQGERRALFVSGFSIVVYNYLLAFSSQETTREKIGTGLVAGYLGFQTYNLTRTVARLRRYRPAHEQQLLADWQRGQQLPRWCRRQLGPYLRPAPAPDSTRR